MPLNNDNPLRGGGDIEQLQKWANRLNVDMNEMRLQIQRLSTLLNTIIQKNNLTT
jgi:hypothetical protein